MLFVFFSGLASNFVSTIISMIILISACHQCIILVTINIIYVWVERVCFRFINTFISFQKTALIKNIEKLLFWTSEYEKLHSAKRELISQINSLDLSINGKGFFIINKEYIAGVSDPIMDNEKSTDIFWTIFNCFRLQMAAACCTYIVIFVQMHMGLWILDRFKPIMFRNWKRCRMPSQQQQFDHQIYKKNTNRLERLCVILYFL